MSRQASSDPLPYVQVDRAVRAKAALLAGTMGVTVQHALGSLVEWWDLCGDPRELESIVLATPPGQEPAVVLADADLVLRFRLASGHEVRPEVLTRLGLAEALESGTYRVRGMSRYFAPIVARLVARRKGAAGGKASAEARRQAGGTAQPRSSRRSGSGSASATPAPEADSEAASKQRRSSAEAGTEAAAEPARTLADSGQRTPLPYAPSERAPELPGLELAQPASASPTAKPPKDAPKRASKGTPDARHAPLVAALVAAGAAFAERNARDVTSLLALATQSVGHESAPGEVLARWRRALARTDFPRVRTLDELVGKWGHFGAPVEATSVGGRPVPEARCVACGAPAPTGWPEAGVPTCHQHAIEASEWCHARGLRVWEGGAVAWLERERAREPMRGAQ